MQLTKNLVPLTIRFAKYSEAWLANNQQYSPKLHWLGPKPSSPKPRPKLEPRGPSQSGKRKGKR